MKQQRIFPGVILLGFGAYFYLQQAHIILFSEFFTWPTLLMIVGIAFLAQGYVGKDHEAILPGTILVGFGLHFHLVNRMPVWPDHMGVFVLILALGFLLRYQKTGTGMFQGGLFLILSILMLFSDRTAGWFGFLGGQVGSIVNLWPFVLMLIGAFLLFFKRK
ncbi:hypothetical protein ANABIO32_04310 [Rossellomorea marisflavi]|uniref:LiaI-LiaF-like domain-containing protein n=1 Tax=Rossellomorea marisflavi TaxID=189381 RepID=UPI0025CB361E|nr:DUF5668 domain-containing protein [Rossellomorea marisflavi]GLI82744.1 hypothetical protein ANABIO32_04310 [Rossellomorea marisflavi]